MASCTTHGGRNRCCACEGSRARAAPPRRLRPPTRQREARREQGQLDAFSSSTASCATHSGRNRRCAFEGSRARAARRAGCVPQRASAKCGESRGKLDAFSSSTASCTPHSGRNRHCAFEGSRARAAPPRRLRPPSRSAKRAERRGKPRKRLRGLLVISTAGGRRPACAAGLRPPGPGWPSRRSSGCTGGPAPGSGRWLRARLGSLAPRRRGCAGALRS